MEMEFEKFNLEKAIELVHQDNMQILMKQQQEGAFIATTQYLNKCFKRLTASESNQVVEIDPETKEITLLSLEDVNKALLFDFNNKSLNNILKTIFSRISKRYNVVCEIGKPLIFEDKINVSYLFKNKIQEYSTFKEETKKAVEFILQFIKEVWANNDEAHYKHLVAWFSAVCKGQRTKTCLYVKSNEGTGKSSLCDFMIQQVLGDGLACVADSQPLKERFNWILKGRLLVVFEELQTFGIREWSGVSCAIKTLITNPMMRYEEKSEKAKILKNTSNVIVLTNYEAIMEAHGRRYFCVDVSDKRIKDYTFFTELHKYMNQPEVGSAFYNYLLEYDITGINFHDVPDTESKKIYYALNLDSISLFVKENYLLKNKDIHCKTTEFYEEYLTFCAGSSEAKKTFKKLEFHKKIESLKLGKNKIINGSDFVSYKLEEIKQVATTLKWLCKYDTVEEVEKTLNEKVLDDVSILYEKYKSLNLDELDKKTLKILKYLNKAHDVITKSKKSSVKSSSSISSLDVNIDELTDDEEKPKKKFKTPKIKK